MKLSFLLQDSKLLTIGLLTGSLQKDTNSLASFSALILTDQR